MKKAAVFFGNTSGNSIDWVYKPEIRNRLDRLAEVYPVIIDRDNIQKNNEALKQAEVAFSTWGMPVFSEEEIESFMPSLKVVFYAAGSVQSFARPFLNKGIKVVSAWAANGVPVAEYTLAQIILANKGFYQSSAMMKGNPQGAKEFFHTLPGNYGVRIGLLGAGLIGTKVIELLKPFDMEILVFDPFLSEERAKELGVKKAELDEIFSTCQTISNHMANLPATVGILNKKHFDLMKENATFINTGRGAQVVENDLAEALKSVPARTAVLDVTVNEPLEPDSPLLTLPNVFLTPHIAGSSGDELARMAEYMLDEFERYEKDEELKYSVTLKMLETMA